MNDNNEVSKSTPSTPIRVQIGRKLSFPISEIEVLNKVEQQLTCGNAKYSPGIVEEVVSYISYFKMMHPIHYSIPHKFNIFDAETVHTIVPN